MDYELDILNRYQHGEFFNEDSIKQTGEVYKTHIGRKVYGGGGIMPDYFVAEDTTEITSYFTEIANKGLIVQYAFEYTDKNRQKLEQMEDAEAIMKHLKRDKALEKFIYYCDDHGVQRRNNMIFTSQRLLEHVLYGAIIYNILNVEEYLKFINKDDVTVKKAIELYEEGLTVPTLTKDDKSTDKKAARRTTAPAHTHLPA